MLTPHNFTIKCELSFCLRAGQSERLSRVEQRQSQDRVRRPLGESAKGLRNTELTSDCRRKDPPSGNFPVVSRRSRYTSLVQLLLEEPHPMVKFFLVRYWQEPWSFPCILQLEANSRLLAGKFYEKLSSWHHLSVILFHLLNNSD